MRKFFVAVSLCILGSSVFAGVPKASADVQINANIQSGHTGIYFSNQPDVVIVPGTRVYYYEAPSYDVFRYGNAWYVDRAGVWYRSSSYRGPFVQVSYTRVPRQVIVVPADYHRHDNGLHKGWYKHHGHHEDNDDNDRHRD